MLANHFCLLAIADSPDDPIAPASESLSVVDQITPNDNNVTHHNYVDLSSVSTTSLVIRWIGGRQDQPGGAAEGPPATTVADP